MIILLETPILMQNTQVGQLKKKGKPINYHTDAIDTHGIVKKGASTDSKLKVEL